MSLGHLLGGTRLCAPSGTLVIGWPLLLAIDKLIIYLLREAGFYGINMKEEIEKSIEHQDRINYWKFKCLCM